MIEPRRTRWRSFALATTVSAVFLTQVTSCALLGKGDPVAPDYLTPSPPEPAVSSGLPVVPPAPLPLSAPTTTASKHVEYGEPALNSQYH